MVSLGIYKDNEVTTTQAISQLFDFSKRTIRYLEADKSTFNKVTGSNIEGRLGFGMIATAMAAFDLYAFLLAPKELKKNRERFEYLFDRAQYFGKDSLGDFETFYGVIRCGVVHQLYPASTSITAQPAQVIFYKLGGSPCVNSWGLYCEIIDGIKRIDADINSSGFPRKRLANIARRLARRVQRDASAAAIDVSKFPELLPPQAAPPGYQMLVTSSKP